MIKERKDHEFHAAKKLNEMENKLSNLGNFKALKIGEEKSYRKEVKNLEKVFKLRKMILLFMTLKNSIINV